jgi:hypothetical protein
MLPVLLFIGLCAKFINIPAGYAYKLSAGNLNLSVALNPPNLVETGLTFCLGERF